MRESRVLRLQSEGLLKARTGPRRDAWNNSLIRTPARVAHVIYYLWQAERPGISKEVGPFVVIRRRRQSRWITGRIGELRDCPKSSACHIQ